MSCIFVIEGNTGVRKIISEFMIKCGHEVVIAESGASCPARDIFKEPDSGLPLRCNMCEDDPSPDKPLCVQWCLTEALIYEEYEKEVEEDQVKLGEMEVGLETLAEKYGLPKLVDALARMTQKP